MTADSTTARAPPSTIGDTSLRRTPNPSSPKRPARGSPLLSTTRTRKRTRGRSGTRGRTRPPHPQAAGAPPATTSTPPTASAAPGTVEPASNDSWKTIGLVVGGAGLASVGASLVLGALALVKNRDADMMCNGSVCSSETGVDLARQSGRLATASTITFFAGLALAGGGLTILLAAPKTPGSAPGRAVALTVSPAAATDLAGLDVHGAF